MLGCIVEAFIVADWKTRENSAFQGLLWTNTLTRNNKVTQNICKI